MRHKRFQEGIGDAAEEADDRVGKRGTHPPKLSRTSQNANCPQFTILHKNGAHGASNRQKASSKGISARLGSADMPMLDIFATCACHR
jgi:hypothetical protein